MENNNLPNYMTDNRGIKLESVKTDPNNPGSFTVSEEEAERLKAMAMANSNSELTEEMKAAMGMVNGDYDKQIPDRVHNHICYDEAKRNNEQYAKESKAFTNLVVPDEATRELLDEDDATSDLSNFDFGDIDEYCEKLGSLSFLEAVSYKKKIDVEIARWKSCKSMLKAISDLRLDDETNRELMKINAMEKYDFLESIDDFESHYEDNLNKLETISSKLVEIVSAHKDEMDSTKFLTDEMIHLMEGKVNKLDPEGMNYTFNKGKMETVINAFKNRLDLTYLSTKLDSYLLSSKANIRRDLRNCNSNNRAKFINDLVRYFSEDIIYGLYERLMCAFNDDAKSVYVMMGLLAKVMNTERKTSRDVWAKVFILNLADMYNNIFDIEEASTEEGYGYMARIAITFHEKIKTFVDAQKDIKIPNYKVNFGLKTPTKKRKELCEEYTAIPPTEEDSENSQPVENTEINSENE